MLLIHTSLLTIPKVGRAPNHHYNVHVYTQLRLMRTQGDPSCRTGHPLDPGPELTYAYHSNRQIPEEAEATTDDMELRWNERQ